MIRSLSIKIILLASTLVIIVVVQGARVDQNSHTPQVKIAEIAKSSSVVNEKKTVDRSQGQVAKNTLDLNRSTAQELETLPGIGPILAKRIVDHRLAVGAFQSIHALEQVKGIGRNKRQILEPLLTVTPKIAAIQQ